MLIYVYTILYNNFISKLEHQLFDFDRNVNSYELTNR